MGNNESSPPSPPFQFETAAEEWDFWDLFDAVMVLMNKILLPPPPPDPEPDEDEWFEDEWFVDDEDEEDEEEFLPEYDEGYESDIWDPELWGTEYDRRNFEEKYGNLPAIPKSYSSD